MIRDSLSCGFLLLALFLIPVLSVAADEAAMSLEDAYKKEYAFLELQKRDLEKRLVEFQQRSTAEQNELESAVASLTERLDSIDEQTQKIREDILVSERALDTKLDHENLLSGTLEQGMSTLDEHGRKPSDDAFGSLSMADKISSIYQVSDQLITDLAGVRREKGAFYLSDGSRAEGELIRIGNIAAFGLSDQGGGALAPAGGGELKVWPESQAEDIEVLSANNPAQPLRLFLYESLQNEVRVDVAQGVVEYINDGGVIGWAIVVLGALAGLLLLVRVALLKIASTDTGYIFKHVAGLVASGKVSEALQACQKRSGSAARVVVATLSNLDRDKEHLENVISEKVLNESPRLDRFGAFILVIAGVAPLLGLLGTVTGMISTFDVITEYGTGDPKMLSGGIATALVTTQLGLVVAIPTLLCGSLLNAWGNRIKDDMERVALHIITRNQIGQE